MSKISKIILKIVSALVLIFLALQTGVFFAIRMGITDVGGGIDANSAEYNILANDIDELLAASSSVIIATSTEEEKDVFANALPKNDSIYGPRGTENWCRIEAAADFDAAIARNIALAYHDSHSERLLSNMLLAMKLRLAEKEEFAAELEACDASLRFIDPQALIDSLPTKASSSLYTWQNGEPWQIISQAIAKDKDRIEKAAAAAGIQPRLLVSVAIVEQLRLYYTQRELFEQVFKPLKILANANKMAWGVMSIKEKMAIATEEHLRDTASPYYIGTSTEHLLAFPADADVAKLRYERLTDERDHYYSYLYGALIIRQFQEQWQRAGSNIDYRPEVVATLFNIGFQNSKPKADPQVGGSTMEIEGQKYFFGSLAYEFYYSGVLMDEFRFE